MSTLVKAAGAFFREATTATGCERTTISADSIQGPDDVTALVLSALSCRAVLLSALMILGSPLGWNVLGRIEHYTRFFTRVFRSKFVGCYITSAYIFTFSHYRNIQYEVALQACTTVTFEGQTVQTLQLALAALLYVLGAIFVISSSWALGIIGTYNGDYFGILMEERITHFPFNVLDNPMYVGSTMLFAARAVHMGSPAGVLLSIWVYLVYRCGCYFEEPFTSMIYTEAAERQQKEDKLAASAHPEEYNVSHAEIESWGEDEVEWWLEHVLELKQYTSVFRRHHIDGSVLVRLDVEQLGADVGIASLGHRFKIVDGAREFQRAFFASLELKKGNKWISERRTIEKTIRRAIDSSIGDIRLVRSVRDRVKKMSAKASSPKKGAKQDECPKGAEGNIQDPSPIKTRASKRNRIH